MIWSPARTNRLLITPQNIQMAKRFTVTLSDDLYEAMLILRKRRKYRGKSEYLTALIRYDGQAQKEHLLTSEWAALSPPERDQLDAAILRQVKSGKGVLGSWLEATISDIVRAHVAAGRTPNVKQVALEVAQRIGECNRDD